MIPGMSGPLVSSDFAGQLLPSQFAGRLGEEDRDAARRRILRCRREKGAALGPASSVRQVFDLGVDPVLHVLGFEARQLRPGGDGRWLVGELRAVGIGTPPLLLVTPWGESLDLAWRTVVRAAAIEGADWCLCANGAHLRLVDARRTYARRFVDFDLDVAVRAPAGFGALWGLLRGDVFKGSGPGPTLLELMIEESARHGAAVCRSLRLGVLDSLASLMGEFSNIAGRVDAGPATPLEQALTVVYRILFLLFAESRHLLPTWHPLYRNSYSMDAARLLAESPGAPRGLWAMLQAMSRLAHSGCRAGSLRVTPFNGRLFSPVLTPAADRARLDDDTARHLVLALSSTPGRGGGARTRIAYRDLDVEQLGAVYESVLDCRPVPPSPGERGTVVTHGGGLRKATGTFYTPRSIASYLVRRTLAPLVARASPDAILGLRVLDPAMGSGAFLVAACRYLASAYEAALVEGGGFHPSDIDEAQRRAFRRLVAQRCLYGVDLNPMAVQLARLSLWLVTLAPDQPLTFLDHHLVVGNSLVGTSIESVFRRPPPGTLPRRHRRHEADAMPLFGCDGLAADVHAILPRRSALAVHADDSLAAVREKERLLAELSGQSSPGARWRRLADLWCAHAFLPGRVPAPAANSFRAVADAILSGRAVLSEAQTRACTAPLDVAAASRRFLHWPIEFPEVFYDESGLPKPLPGFDAVVGNPPWDMVRADNAAAGEDAAGGEAHRSDEGRGARAHDRAENEMLMRFVRESGEYQALGDGHANRFQLFVERAVRLAREGGRVGLVVPWGLAADQGCVPLRRLLFDHTTLDVLVGFENADAIFPIHRSVRFLVATTTKGGTTGTVRCRLGERAPAVLDELPSRGAGPSAFPVRLSRALLGRLSRGDLSLPDIRTPGEAALLERVYSAAPALESRDGWGAEFGRELNATEDRVHFARGGAGLPVLEGRNISPFRVAVPDDAARLPEAAAARLLAPRRGYTHPRLAYRDVASATNRLTVISAVLPAGCVTVHTLFCLRTPLAPREQYLLCAFLNSYVVNYLVRLRVTTHVSAGILRQIPVPRPAPATPEGRRLTRLSVALHHGPVAESRPDYVELQALVARLYRMTPGDFELVLGTFPLVPAGIRAACLDTFRRGVTPCLA